MKDKTGKEDHNHNQPKVLEYVIFIGDNPQHRTTGQKYYQVAMEWKIIIEVLRATNISFGKICLYFFFYLLGGWVGGGWGWGIWDHFKMVSGSF